VITGKTTRDNYFFTRGFVSRQGGLFKSFSVLPRTNHFKPNSIKQKVMIFAIFATL
jgi:hypothetical protein